MKGIAGIIGAGLALFAVYLVVQEFVGPTIFISKSDLEKDSGQPSE